MRIAIVEDNLPLLDNLSLLLDGESDISVVGTFSTAEDVLTALKDISAEIMLVDLGLPDMSGIELIRRIKTEVPKLDILVYTIFDDWKTVYSALKAGAAGYVLKGTTPKELIGSFHNLYQGGAPMTPKIARMVITEFHGDEADKPHPPTSLENDILLGLEKGLTYKELAVKFKMSPHTVQKHIKNIYEKIQAKDRGKTAFSTNSENIGKDINVLLTRREKDVLSCLAEGMADKEISGVLSISEKTVQTYTQNLFKKLKVSNRTEAAVKAVKLDMV